MRQCDCTGVTNLQFVTGDVHALPFADNTSDIVHAHQVLHHLPNPVQALREIRRVSKPGGFVAVREHDIMTRYPELKEMENWAELHERVSHSLGSEWHAGRRLVSWAMQAGCDRASINAKCLVL